MLVFLLSICLPAWAQNSLADIARKNRPKDARPTPKRVWTNDDIASSNVSDESSQKTKNSDSETLEKFRSLAKEQLGDAVLRMSGIDVDFPNRKDWEQRLFDAKQAWVLQIDRTIAHKDAAKDSRDEELRLAIGAKRIFERIRDEGVEQARATKDPVLKAHLDYRRQEEFCKQTSGDLQIRCQESLEQLRIKMEREGTW